MHGPTKQHHHHINPVTVHAMSSKGGKRWSLSPEFSICCSMSKQFYFQWEAFNLLSKIGYILWVVRRCWKPVTSPTWSPSRILPRIRNQIKTVGIGNFLCLTCKIIIMIIIINFIQVSCNF